MLYCVCHAWGPVVYFLHIWRSVPEILGPNLSHIADVSHVSLLRIEMPMETQLVDYADGGAVLITTRNVEEAQPQLGRVMQTVDRWMRDHCLTLALYKTEIVVIPRRISRRLIWYVGELDIETKPTTKYFEVIICSKMSFVEQYSTLFRQSCQKRCFPPQANSQCWCRTLQQASTSCFCHLCPIVSFWGLGSHPWSSARMFIWVREFTASCSRIISYSWNNIFH